MTDLIRSDEPISDDRIMKPRWSIGFSQVPPHGRTRLRIRLETHGFLAGSAQLTFSALNEMEEYSAHRQKKVAHPVSLEEARGLFEKVSVLRLAPPLQGKTGFDGTTSTLSIECQNTWSVSWWMELPLEWAEVQPILDDLVQLACAHGLQWPPGHGEMRPSGPADNANAALAYRGSSEQKPAQDVGDEFAIPAWMLRRDKEPDAIKACGSAQEPYESDTPPTSSPDAKHDRGAS